jgi:hypothetical protein
MTTRNPENPLEGIDGLALIQLGLEPLPNLPNQQYPNMLMAGIHKAIKGKKTVILYSGFHLERRALDLDGKKV